jgi:hypothetical protein
MLPPKAAIACTSSWFEPPANALGAVGGTAAKPPSDQSNRTVPKLLALVI